MEKNLKERIIRLCCGGFGRETFSVYHKMIEEQNSRIFTTIAMSGIVIVSSLLLLSFFHWLFAVNHFLYLGLDCILISCLAYYRLSLQKQRKSCLLLLYLAVFCAYLFAILMGTVNAPDGNAVTICVLITLTPIFILDYPWRIQILNALSFLIFTAFAFVYKLPRYSEEDVINLFIFLIASIPVSYFAIQLKVQNIVARADLKAQRDTDFLTKVSSRSAVIHSIERSLKKGENGSLMLVDIDGFKQVNDLFGHVMGDEVLAEIARTLEACAGDNTCVGRYGGDEFLIFFPGVTDRKHLAQSAGRIIQQSSRTIRKGPQSCVVSVSIGIAVSEGAGDCDLLCRQADQAMYAAKGNGKNTFSFYPGEANSFL